MSTGAGNDIERATELARKMVCEWGMSDLGPLTFGKKEEQIFLGREIAQHRDYSEATAIKIDDEVRRLIGQGYDTAKGILADNHDTLIRIALALLEREVLDANEIKMLIDGKELPKIRLRLEVGRWRAAGAEAGAGTAGDCQGRRESGASVSLG